MTLYPERGLTSTPVLPSQALEQQLEGPWDITEGKLSQFSTKTELEPRSSTLWHFLVHPFACICRPSTACFH